MTGTDDLGGGGQDDASASSESPWEQGRPTIFVYSDERGEVQVGAMNQPEGDLGEMAAVLEVARAKLELLAVRILRRQAQEQAGRSRLLIPQ